MRRLLCALLSVPILAFAQGGLPNLPYIYVEGKTEVDRPAGIVTLHFDAVARNVDQVKANQEAK